ncbi:hypothetical protein SDC9_114476 [bioreactor metagenome]|uniref:Uncharacterized protein n=1 Tax=bioreactor metagenome TaxID=1076179 RepID=A0A645BWP8_9ZZZZ
MPVIAVLFVDQCRIIFHGVAAIHVNGQRFIIHFDLGQGVLCMGNRIRHYSRNRLTDIADLLYRHGHQVADVIAVAIGASLARDHFDDTRHLFSFCGIDLEDLRMGVFGP